MITKLFSSRGNIPSQRFIHQTKQIKLVSLDWTRPKDPPLSLGHASILANLKANHLDYEEKSWSVNHPTFDVQKVVEFLMTSPTSNTYAALGAFVWNEEYIQQILKELKIAKFPGKVLLGGPQISYLNSNIEQYYPNSDIFIRGYAEDVLVKLFQSPDNYPSLSGVHYAGQSSNLSKASIDLNTLPSPFLTGIIPKQHFLRWESQRGCPYRCSFCQHRESDAIQRRRCFPTNRILQEIDWITQDNIVQDLAVIDPTFNADRSCIPILQRFIENKYSGKISLQCRLESISSNFLDLVMELNQTGKVVLEFGLQTIHLEEQKIIQRNNHLGKITKILQEIDQRNINSEISLIYGLPQQTLHSFQQSLAFCKQFPKVKIFAFPLMLLNGTPLFYQKDEYGLIESSDLPPGDKDSKRIHQGIPHVIQSNTFSYDDWLQMNQLAQELDQYNNQLQMI